MTIENSMDKTIAATAADLAAVKVILVSGADAAYVPLAKRAADYLSRFLATQAWLNDGQGNCGVISAILHAVTTSAGYKARLLGGNCIDLEGQAPFGRRGGHFWVALPDGTVMDGAGTNRIQIYRPETVGLRMIPVIGHRNGAACMRKTKTLLELSSTVQKAISAKSTGFLWSDMHAA